jgi:hypothetical protein
MQRTTTRQTIGPADQQTRRPKKQASQPLHTAVIDNDVVQLGIPVPRLARAVELAGVQDGLLDLVFGLDDLQRETHRDVPADVAVHPKNDGISMRFGVRRRC